MSQASKRVIPTGCVHSLQIFFAKPVQAVFDLNVLRKNARPVILNESVPAILVARVPDVVKVHGGSVFSLANKFLVSHLNTHCPVAVVNRLADDCRNLIRFDELLWVPSFSLDYALVGNCNEDIESLIVKAGLSNSGHPLCSQMFFVII